MSVYSQFIVEKELFSEYLKVNVTGIAQTNDIKNLYREIFNIVENNGINKVLLDCVQLELDYDSSEVLRIMKAVQQQLSRLKLARIVSNRSHKQMLIQQIADDRELTMKNFNCFGTALSWLLNE